MRQRKLLAQQFDAITLTLAGEPIAIAESVLSRDDNGAAAFAVAEAGTLLYRSGSTQTGQSALIWIDRSGKISSPIPIGVGAEYIGLSPDGTRVAFSAATAGAETDIWTYDLERNLREPLTSDPSTDHSPVWSPDGFRIAFDSHRGGSGGHVLYEKRADGATPERPLVQPEPGMSHEVLDWTSEYVVFRKHKRGEQVMDIWAMPLSGDRKPFPYLTGVGHTNAALSPNGRWLAYVAHEGGTSQVVVRSFPDPSQNRQQISSNGGAFPRWRRDGRELFYLDSSWRMVAVPIGLDATLSAGSPIELFAPPSLPMRPWTVGYPYGVTPDGQRFLFSVLPGALDTSAPITVVMNWQSALTARERR